jgi:hypothetical protein
MEELELVFASLVVRALVDVAKPAVLATDALYRTIITARSEALRKDSNNRYYFPQTPSWGQREQNGGLFGLLARLNAS